MNSHVIRNGLRGLSFALVLTGVRLHAAEWYVDAENGSDVTGNGSSALPFATINAATTNKNLKADDVVWVRPGTYSNGVATVASYGRARVYISKRIRLESTGGRDVTHIVGFRDMADPTGGTGDCLGCGTDSIRGIYAAKADTIIKGFTIRDGASAYTNTNAKGTSFEVSQNMGGGVLGADCTVVVADCVISNCTGRYGGAMNKCVAVRCLLTENTGNHTLRNSYALNSVLTGNSPGTAILSSSRAVNCTVAGNPSGYPAHAGEGYLLNCIVTENYSSSIFNVSAENKANTILPAETAQSVINAADGDCRLVKDSPAIGYGDRQWINNADVFTVPVEFATNDYAGTAYSLTDMTPFNAGAYQTTATFIEAPQAAPGILVTGIPSGVTYISAPVVVSVARDPDFPRNCYGFTTNGAPVLFADWPQGWSKTIARGDASLTIGESLVSTNWYVNAAMPDDSLDGFTPATAKKTLAGVMTNAAVMAGDCVHAARGTYDVGTMLQSADSKTETPFIRARVVVPTGVSLVSDEGAEKTVIVGARGVDAFQEETYGTGSNAVRCAFMMDRASLRGFTLTGGRTLGVDSGAAAAGDNANTRGAAVCVEFYSTSEAHVYDCIVSNNVAYRGGAGYGAHFHRCQFYDNRTPSYYPGCHFYSRLYDCVIDRNRGSHINMYCPVVQNCTIGPGNTSPSGTDYPSTVLYYSQTAQGKVVNTIVYGRATDVSGTYSHCLFYTNEMRKTGWSLPSLENAGPGSKFFRTGVLDLRADGYPTNAHELWRDTGTNEVLVASETDVAGGPRVYNGRIDCGAYEYDWRGEYTAAVGGRRFAVTNASPDVVLIDGKVTLTNGASVVCSWGPRSAEFQRTIPVCVTGPGILTVTVDGVVVGTADAGDTSVTYAARAETESVRIAFAGEGSATFSRPRVLSGLSVIVK